VSKLEKIRARHPVGDHMCAVCEEYGCAERMSPYYDRAKNLGTLCDTAVVLADRDRLAERVRELERGALPEDGDGVHMCGEFECGCPTTAKFEEIMALLEKQHRQSAMLIVQQLLHAALPAHQEEGKE
jgi:hypothetical protein